MADHKYFENLIWQIADLLRGPYRPPQYINAETAKLDALRLATERTIALPEERRAALIAVAVTGKIDVRVPELIDCAAKDASC